jgi:hypothetical protein
MHRRRRPDAVQVSATAMDAPPPQQARDAGVDGAGYCFG